MAADVSEYERLQIQSVLLPKAGRLEAVQQEERLHHARVRLRVGRAAQA